MTSAAKTSKTMHNKDKDSDIKPLDPIAFTQALIDVYERAQPVIDEFIQKQEENFENFDFDPLNVTQAYSEYIQSFWQNPEKFWALNNEYMQKSFALWQESTLKAMGEQSPNGSHAIIEPEKGDRRFKADEWNESALFDFIKQSYLLTCEWMDKSVRGADTLSDEQREKLAFATRLFTGALSPTNFALTNPEVIEETLKTGGENLIRGLENLIEDMERGHGELKISTTDYDAFKLGENIATTKGAVVYQNDLIQLIQYEPATKDVFKRPLLVIPPWINKYYILDLRPDNSFIKWATEQGHSVFIISWVNPDTKLAGKRFEDYMDEGVIAALDAIKDITDEPDCNVVGYCLGGTLLSITLAYLNAKGEDNRIASATFLTTLMDFEKSGDMKLFMDDEQLKLMDRQMAETGVLQAKALQKTFSLLRANDLIWSFVVNNYLMGKEAFPFDLLYWNDDSTNMPAAMHSFYLRRLYRDNLLVKAGGISMHDTPIDIGKIKTPAYFLSTREDHIAPWKATYQGTQHLAGKKTFTLAASGHIAGVVNPTSKNKYCYWSADKTPADPDQWLESAKENKGSWWPHWQKWIESYAGNKVPARKIKNSLEPAPGSYVKIRSE